MFGWLLMLVALAFTAYAFATEWKNTDTAQPTPKRVKAAFYAAAVAIGGAITSFVTDMIK